ncbi:4-hydroxy-tetrahydrodipicolinate synthase [Bartonella sp. DGB1]|uniref:4-hydroxy-tetrahydrodipicolinate synthase n=1 Tax=Bartonella sp. DGB1 TaxID=3239807 RepID=UPI0035255389
MFKGAITALVTPFTSDNKIDEEAFRNLVEWQISESIHGLVPCGTTGESPTLSHDEHKRVIELCVKQTKGRVPVIAGAGSNSTCEAIELAEHAQKAGADAILVVSPYYNKPSQKGLFEHYKKIAKSVQVPLIIYNIPGRSVIDVVPETIAALRNECNNIIGVKDATCEVARVTRHREMCGKDFLQFSGDDSTSLGFNAHGGCGCISVTSNIAPKLCATLQQACLDGDYHKAREIHDKLAELDRILFIEPNPTGVKYALSKLGRIKPFVRSPLYEIEDALKVTIDAALIKAGLL